MAEAEDVNTIRRRSRRRLVGAIALVLVAVIVLPMVFDPEPRTAPPPVSVRIPGEDESTFDPKTAARSGLGPAPEASKGLPAPAPRAPREPETKTDEKAAEAASPEKRPVRAEEQGGTMKPAVEVARARPQEKPAYASPEEQARAQAALADAQLYVPVGAYLDPDGVLEKLKAAKLPFYTEPLATKKGQVMRVRAGPFANREEAEKALEQLKALGFKPGNVAGKS